MKVWLYSHLRESPGNALILEEAQRRGHDFKLIDPARQNLLIGSMPRDNPDLVYTRIGSAAPTSAFANLSVLEQSGVRCLNSAAGLLRSRDKTMTYALLAAAGVPFPKTIVLGDSESLDTLPGPPWVLKLSVSTKGQGVCLVESERSLRSVVDALRETGQSLLLQEFISEARGADTRVVVLGGKARVAARRQAASNDEFRSNVYLGGKAHRIELTDKMAFLAESAAAAMGLEIAGVDLLESRDGHLVVEVNGSPGLTAAPNLPSVVMDYLEEQAP